MKPLLTQEEGARRRPKAATVLLALSALAFVGSSAVRWFRRPVGMTLEQCIEVARQRPDVAVTNALRVHVSKAIEALRQCGPNGAEQLRQIAEDASR